MDLKKISTIVQNAKTRRLHGPFGEWRWCSLWGFGFIYSFIKSQIKPGRRALPSQERSLSDSISHQSSGHTFLNKLHHGITNHLITKGQFNYLGKAKGPRHSWNCFFTSPEVWKETFSNHISCWTCFHRIRNGRSLVLTRIALVFQNPISINQNYPN